MMSGSDEAAGAVTGPHDVGSSSTFPMQNNFDLLRLVAAIQVVYFHAQFHLRTTAGVLGNPLRWALGPLTGVPIFFIISGFLVSASLERRHGLLAYGRNRAVRIYPALWVCLAVSLGLLAAGGYLWGVGLTPQFGTWLAGQLTIGQFLHFAPFRAYATGIPNGSLWTISVEVLFYLGLPILYFLFVDHRSRAWTNISLAVLGAVSFGLATMLVRMDPDSQATMTKLLAQTPLPYLYLFLIGIICQRNFDRIAQWVVGRPVWWALAYYGISTSMKTNTCKVALGWCPAQSAVPDAALFLVSQLVLGGLILSVAFTARTLSATLLRGNDVSYGTYLYHMVLINILVDAEVGYHLLLTPAILIGSVGLGWLSWRFVERPAMRRWKALDGARGPSDTGARR